MIPLRFYLFRLAAVVAALVMLIGCTPIMKTDKIPTLQTGSPLKGIAPKTFAFKEFKDQRPTKDPFLVEGESHSGQWKLDQTATTVVATAVRKELERNGHTCVVDSSQSKADFVIEGALYRYSYIRVQSLVKTKVTAYLKMELTVRRVSPREGALTKSYQGEYGLSDAGGGISRGTMEDILNQAILETVKQISTDPELISFLKE